jgi:hypothetical protein
MDDKAIAGAIFDFVAHLSEMPEVFTIGAGRGNSKLLVEVGRWAKSRGLSLMDADVGGWNTKSER